jgi:chromate transporter
MIGLHGLGAGDLAQLFCHFMLLSMLAVGGAIATAPDMQRYLVVQQGWLSGADFTASIALAQAAPGPNILFVALLGWNAAGAAGLLATMSGIMLPSSALALAVGRWGRVRRDAPAMRAFTVGMAPITIGLLASTAWILSEPTRERLACAALVAATLAVMLRTKASPLWLIALGAAVGVLGWI